jgi:hypothetical protein
MNLQHSTRVSFGTPLALGMLAGSALAASQAFNVDRASLLSIFGHTALRNQSEQVN